MQKNNYTILRRIQQECPLPPRLSNICGKKVTNHKVFRKIEFNVNIKYNSRVGIIMSSSPYGQIK